MRFLLLIFSFLFLFGSFHSVQAQEADKAQIEDDIFGLEADFDFEKPEKTPYAEKLSEIVEMEHGYYGDMIIHGQKINRINNLWEYFIQSAFDNDVDKYREAQGYNYNLEYPMPADAKQEGKIPNDVLSGIPANQVRQYFSKADEEQFADYIDVAYIVNSVLGIPKHKVLNRWPKQTITITTVSNNKYRTKPEISEIIKEELLKKIKSLNEKTNLNIIYQDGLGKKADIILRSAKMSSDIVISTMGRSKSIFDVLYGEITFPGGYIIPDHNNEILKAYCTVGVPDKRTYRERLLQRDEDYIAELDANDIRAVNANIEICLLRSLGLTGEVDKKGLMFVKYEEPISALTDMPDYKVSNGEIVFDPKELIAIRNKVMSENDDFFMFDLIVLKLLYCDLYKPQMDLNEAQFYYPSCFLQAVDFREKEK